MPILPEMALLRGCLAALLLAVSALALGQDATLTRARQLIDANQAKAAYELLAPLEQQRSGEPDFDYLLGIAAIDAGERTRGIFALERVLAVQPNHPQARAEIARAYFLIGETATARQEFETVKSQRPPAEVAAAVDRFLDAIEGRERGAGSGLTGYLEATLGTDDNVNAATSSQSIGIPAFGGTFALAPGASRQRDDYLGLGGGVFGRYALAKTWALIGNASFDQKLNSKLDQFDTGSLNASGGLSFAPNERDEFTIAAQFQSYSVDNTRFRDAAGLVAQWRRKLTDADQLTIYGQQSRLKYPTQPLRDADRSVLGAAWAHTFAGARSPVLFTGLYGGEESELGQNVPENGHRLWGARIGGRIGLTEKWSLLVNYSYEDRRYGGPDPLFLVNRHDKDSQLRVAGNYELTRNWIISPQVAYSDVRSNVVINDYTRTMVSVTARYDFR